jgi:signal peptidase I
LTNFEPEKHMHLLLLAPPGYNRSYVQEQPANTPPSNSPLYPEASRGQLSNAPLYDPNQPASPKKRRFKSIISTALLLLLAPVIALTITTFMFQSYQVDGMSMETTLQNGDRLIINKIPVTFSKITHGDYYPGRGDIIIFNQDGFSESGNDRQLIKRVIGLPGDRVVVKDDKVTVYNSANPNGFNPDTHGDYLAPETTKITSGSVDLTVNPGEVFVLGDNRQNSADSRIFGTITTDTIVGKLVMRILPLGNSDTF